MSVLSDAQILTELNTNIVITPFNFKNLGNCSYDITLGKYYYGYNYEHNGSRFNPFNEKSVAEFWSLKECQLITTQEEADLNSCNIGDEIIIIPPGETILGHTQEFIGGKHNITTMMKARSGVGRSCVNICKDAGWGDVGYINRWTLEIQNTGPHPVVLPVGSRVGQIVFFYTGQTNNSYEKNGSYQASNNITDLEMTWKPEMMLPKLYNKK